MPIGQRKLQPSRRPTIQHDDGILFDEDPRRSRGELDFRCSSKTRFGERRGARSTRAISPRNSTLDRAAAHLRFSPQDSTLAFKVAKIRGTQ